MSKVNDVDINSILPSSLKWPDIYKDNENWKVLAHRYADRFSMELDQIIKGKLNEEDSKTYNSLIKNDYDILLYILFKHDVLERPIVFPHFYPIYVFLRSKIPDIYEIGQTLEKDISNDF